MNHFTHKAPDKKPLYMQATGQLPHPLTNDYMFKALLQKNENVLKHLTCSLLHLRPDEVKSVEIRNPIVLGEALTEDFDSKIFVLDINVLLNNQLLINLEMQVVDYANWPERAMTYLCRNFDQLSRGDDYIKVMPTIHIGFLDFTLFPEHPEFYATYKMMNVKNHHIFTDKLTLSVVNLRHIELATQEDRKWKIDYWASLFKATTWEELKMLAKQNPILEDAVETIYELTADESIREQCKAREKHIREMNTVLREKEIVIQELNKTNQKLNETHQKLDEAAQKLDQATQQLDQATQQLDQTTQQLDQATQQLDQATQERDEALRQIEQLLQENKRLKEQQEHIV